MIELGIEGVDTPSDLKYYGKIFGSTLGTFTYQCTFCCEQFEVGTDFESHILEEHVLKECSNLSSDQQPNYETTLIDIKIEPQYDCDIREDRKTTIIDLFEDYQDIQPNANCDTLQLSHKIRRLTARSNSDNINAANNVKCECCYQSFACNGLRDLHNHQSFKDYVKCQHCPTFFPNKVTRIQHNKIHRLPIAQQQTCPHCSRIFQCSVALNQHIYVNQKQDVLPKVAKDFVREPGKVKQPIYECDMCDRKFAKKMFIEQHLLRHTQNTLDCSICQKRFKAKRDLKKHMYKHTGERPFKCPHPQCEKAFQHESYVTIHMRQHTGEKPYQCAQCGRSFYSSGSLTSHIRLYHDKIRNNVCDICDQRFRQPSLLRDHIRSKHTLERPFNCTVCGQTFSTRKVMKQHAHIHQEKRFKCNYCEKVFAQSAGRRYHEKYSHNVA